MTAARMTAARAAAARAAAAFGADMYQVLAEDADMVFSPASVASALQMAWYGARGQTAAELARALRLDGSLRQEDVAASALSLPRDGAATLHRWLASYQM